MITAGDFYKVVCAMVPLYFAMLVAYASVKWCKLFTTAQCSGINRFVSVFAVPVLSFDFISQNNPYQMDTKFILADTISKLFLLFLLSLWVIFFPAGTLDWLITLFSLATLPNAVVIGIPLLQAMYGDFTQTLIVQIFVLQCIIWYTLLLFLFEYRAAVFFIKTQFLGPTAASITKFEVDDDVISLDGRDVPLRAESETDNNGRIRVRIRRSTSSAPESALSSFIGITTPRPSNLSNADIFSVNTPIHLHEFHHASSAGGGSDTGSGYASSDAYSLQPTPRASNFNELETMTTRSTPIRSRSPVPLGKIQRQSSPACSGSRVVWESPGKVEDGERQGCEDITMSEKEISFRECTEIPMAEETDPKDAAATNQKMPHALVMIRLILNIVGRKLLRNPNTYSSVLGLLWSLISFKWNLEMPSLVKSSIKIISDAGIGMAMFSLGLFMALQPRMMACGAKTAAMGMLIRFICGPLVMSAASIAIGLRGPKLRTAIVQAALPQAVVPFVFAMQYGLHPDILSTGVIFGMLVSLPVTLLYYIFLGL